MTLTADPETWAYANCVQNAVAPETMQPDRATREEVQAAKSVCGGCPLWWQCRDLAKATDAYGVHAGTWWGEPPVWEVEHECENDGCTNVVRHAEARPGRFCSTKCRTAAHWRAQQADGKVSA